MKWYVIFIITFLIPFIAPLITSTDDVNEVKISIPDKLTNTATASNMLRLYQPCGSPELLQGILFAVSISEFDCSIPCRCKCSQTGATYLWTLEHV